MGCKLTKDEIETDIQQEQPEMQHNNKAKLERKLCLAKETPESDFDISDCGLKEVPSGVFVLCRVLRKDSLILATNHLSSLKGGGLLSDLSLIRVLDLRQNRFKKLPEELTTELVELRELFLSENQLEALPNSLSKLRRLEILDLSNNNLSSVENVAFLANLRVLNLSRNPKLTVLSSTLATCDSLIDLIVDGETVLDPPSKVIELGTRSILDYLMGALRPDEIDSRRRAIMEIEPSQKLIESERGYVQKEMKAEKILEDKTNLLLEAERRAIEKDYLIEAQLHSQQQKRRQELLKEIYDQQQVQDHQLNQLNIEKNQNRDNLIKNIIETEEKWKRLVEQSIELKSFNVDPVMLEQEAKEQDRLLETLRLQQDDLRKQEILQAMQGFLENELNQVDLYQRQRDISSKNVLIKENENSLLLMDVFLDYNKNKSQMVEQIQCDESIQKSAVATLIAKNDARSWAVVEQMKIIENQLAAMSIYEIDKRKEFSSQQINELAEKRANLTAVLLELLAQQDLRKKELLDTLSRIERERDDRKDFWLLQYQRLLDSQPENVEFGTTIDPVLGYNLLVNNVVHCLPFLSKLWHSKSKELHEIIDEDLIEAGIRSESDRVGILNAIGQYLKSESKLNAQPTAPTVNLPNAPNAPMEDEPEDRSVDQEEQLAECVICMDEKVKIIFLLCGHLACCDNCHESVDICPMCRAPIQQRIRVIQA